MPVVTPTGQADERGEEVDGDDGNLTKTPLSSGPRLMAGMLMVAALRELVLRGWDDAVGRGRGMLEKLRSEVATRRCWEVVRGGEQDSKTEDCG